MVVKNLLDSAREPTVSRFSTFYPSATPQISAATSAYILAESTRSSISTNFSGTPGSLRRGKPNVADGIPTSFKTVSIVELGFAGNVLREIYRIDLKDGSVLDVATGKTLPARAPV